MSKNKKNKIMPRVHTVKRAQKDYPAAGIKKGDTYYWWKFRYGSKHMSKTYPKASQLTQSDYLSRMYEFQERLADVPNMDTLEDIEMFRDELVNDVQELLDETQEKLDNMPESLQYSPTGELLQERIDALENAVSELDNVDLSDYDEKEDAEVIELLKEDNMDDGYEPSEEEITERKEQSLQEWIEEKTEEIQAVSFE